MLRSYCQAKIAGKVRFASFLMSSLDRRLEATPVHSVGSTAAAQ